MSLGLYKINIKMARNERHNKLKAARRHIFVTASLITFLLVLVDCASIPSHRVAVVPIDQFQAFSGPNGKKITPESVDDTIPDVDILALGSEIKSVLDESVIPIRDSKKRLDEIVKILIQKVRYTTEEDRYGAKTAQETFDTGTGNCLSFSNLFVAMARYAGLKTEFQEIPTPPNWIRNGEVLFFTRHIGASIDIVSPMDQTVQLYVLGENRVMVHDNIQRYLFTPSQLDPFAPEINPFSIRPIPDHRAFAQYYNNIGSQYLAEGDATDAFRYFVKAVKIDPKLSFAWSNLGVVYNRNNQVKAAKAAFFQGMSVTHGPDDVTLLTIMSNMARLYKKIGDTEKAEFYKKEVASFREKNPYYQYAIAKTAYHDRFYEKSVKYYKAAIQRKNDEHLFYYGLALAYLKLGEIKKAEKNLDKAKHYAWDDENKAYYDRLREKLFKRVSN